MVSADRIRRAYVRQHDDVSRWVEHVAEATVHDTSQTSLVTYATVRTLWLRRTLADLEARTVLSALCSAASPARSSGQDR
jgi:predicted ABC-type ATPase